MTENEAALAYVSAWKNYDPMAFLNLLSEDVTYNSQWVFEEMKGKEKFVDYFTGKLETVKRANMPVRAIMGKTTRSFPDRDCVLLFQSKTDAPDALVLFEISGDLISKVDMCIPELFAPIRAGV
ncbi:MAG: nuclear transport factor 2 family protein [Pseudobdellovibrionaceae bacterium]|jgi:hypothetical protein|nr:nuclear transport factor 2 family protein [Pseudobdellovibrionaceae bacterium]